MTPNDLARFWGKVALPDAGSHMLWTASLRRDGYPQFRLNGTVVGAHRVACEIAHGPPPSPEHHAAHAPVVCHRPECVAPDHLRWATPQENSGDQVADGTRGEGERNSRAKLTDDRVRLIRVRRASGVTLQSLADELGVAFQTVAKAAARETWRHVDA